MFTYLIYFSLSIGLLYFSSTNLVKRDKYTRTTIEFISLFLMCLMAAIRSESVGTDVTWYLKPLFNFSLSSQSFSEFYKESWYIPSVYTTYYVKDIEFGFSSLVYIVSNLFKNISIVFLVIEILIIFPIYFGIKKFEILKDNTWLPMLLFYFCLYNITFNLMRQMIAIAFIFYGMSLLLNKNNIKNNIYFWAIIILAFLFHRSSILGLLIYVIFEIFYMLESKVQDSGFILFKKIKVQWRYFVFFIFIILEFVILFSLDYLQKLFELIGLGYYFKNYLKTPDFMVSKLIKALPLLAIAILTFKERHKKDKNTLSYLFYYLTYSLVLSHLCSVNPQNLRIGFIFQIFDIVFFSLIFFDNKKFNVIINSFIILYFGFYWYYTFVYLGTGETIPFIANKIGGLA